MKISHKKSNLSRIAFLTALITITSSGYAAANNNEAMMQDVGAFVYAVDGRISDIFNQNNRTSLAVLIVALEKVFTDFKRKCDENLTRSNDELTKDINDLVDYVLYQFSIACSIMKKYCGKPSSEAISLGTEIKRDFNTDKIFSEILTKLRTLKCKVEKNKEHALAKKVEVIISMVEKKKKEWAAKSDVALVTALACRLNYK
jgi:hypothetical protein